jgi:hypothetical protein
VKFKYTLANKWIKEIAHMESFVNGATQVSVRLNDGQVFGAILTL